MMRISSLNDRQRNKSILVGLGNLRFLHVNPVWASLTTFLQVHSFTTHPSLSPYSPADRITDRETNTLAARGLEEPFFQLCCCVSVFWFWWEKGFGVTNVLRVQYSCGVVLVFWSWWEIVFGVAYILSVQYSCTVVSVFW